MTECAQCHQLFQPLSWGPVECPHCGAMVFVPQPEAQAQAPTPSPKWTSYTASPTVVLIALNILMFVVTLVVSRSVSPDVMALQRLGANYAPRIFTGEWWRLFTSMFLHGGLLHLAFNMWALFNVGILAEILYGRRNFVWIYVLAGLGGSIASVWWHPGIVGVGASGAIFGVAGALIPAHAFQKNERLRAALKGNLGSLSMFVIYNLAIGAASPHIDNAAHLGGLAIGALAGWLMPSHTVTEERGDNRRTAIAVILVSTILFAGAWMARRSGAAVVALQHGQDALAAGNTHEAIQFLQQATEQNPKLVQSQMMLAYALGMESRYGEAIPHWRKLVDIEPERGDWQENLCIAYLRNEQPQEAVASCEKAASLRDKDADAWFNLGLVYRTNGRTADATRAFGNALRLHNGFDENYFYGVSLVASGQRAKAVPYLQAALQMRPEDHRVRLALDQALHTK